jgi:hypothetical protein
MLITIKRAREILGSKAEGMDDNAINQLLSEIYLLADIIIEKAKKEPKYDKKSCDLL